MENSEKQGRIAGWLMGLAMRLPGARGALRRLLLRGDGALFKEAIWRPLVDEGDGTAILGPGHERLWDVLARDDHARLRERLFDDGHALFKSLAQSSECTPLKAALFDDGYGMLKELLSLRGHEALKAVMLDGDPEWFAMIVRARQGEPLADLLFADDAFLLRHVCRLRGVESLIPLLQSLETSERVVLARTVLCDGGPGALELLARMPDFQAGVLALPRLHAMVALLDTWESLRPILPTDDPDRDARLRKAVGSIARTEHVRGRVLDAITEEDRVRLAHGTLRFPCRHSLWTLMHEILLNEDYYFRCESGAPVIIDGGAHMGMAIYYFKTRYPASSITAFEPHPALRELALENVARNGWEGVEVLPLALAGTRREATFHISETWSMAGSLADRRASLGDDVSAITVQCVPLGDYLRTPVDFLKLDIEGAEDEVLEAAAPWLHHVGQIFCEFHQGAGLGSGRLARILGLLEEAGFDAQVGKSHNYQEDSRWRPLTHFDGAASAIIWARNRRLRD